MDLDIIKEMVKTENKPVAMLALFAVLVFGVLAVVLLSLGDDGKEDLAVSEPFEKNYFENQKKPSYSSLGAKDKGEKTLSDVELGTDEIREFVSGYVPSVVLPKPEPVYEDDFVAGTISKPYFNPGYTSPAERVAASEDGGYVDWVPPTDEEVFQRLFPDFYLDGLSSRQDLLINTGYFKEEDRLTFDSLDNVVEGLDRGLLFLLDSGNITQEEYTKLRKGLYGEFSDLIKYEWEQLKNENGPYDMNKIKEGSLNVKNFWPPRLMALYTENTCGGKEGVFLGIWRKIIGFFSPESAYAGGGCGFDMAGGVCVEGVLCYRTGPPVPGGVNLWAPCCCCCAGKTPIGCLNAVCTGLRAAIWDPMTGICGCG